MLRASRGVDGRAMWANLNLLFWLSLVPFSTAWLGRNPLAVGPTAFYSVIFLLDAVAYTLLQRSLLAVNGAEAPFAKAVATDVKGRLSLALYVIAIGVSFFLPILRRRHFDRRGHHVASTGSPVRASDQYRIASSDIGKRTFRFREPPRRPMRAPISAS